MSSVTQRATSAWRVLRAEGPRPLAQRLARVGYHRLNAAELEFALLPGDVTSSSSLDLPLPDRRPGPDEPLTIGWITTPPAAGSGGHTTMFRMVEALESGGHRCVLFLYDRYGGDASAQAEVIRSSWPQVRAEVRSIDDGVRGVHACIATSWQTAHVLAVRTADVACRRMYFAQDFEPFFYARGSDYALAEDTYRFGFTTVSIGHMVADLVAEVAGVRPAVAEFGCDTDVYQLRPQGPRNGIAFYAKPGTARRGYALAALGVAEFHRERPDVEVHLYGDASADLPFEVTRHGNMRPAELAALYNRCRAGIAMSFTNISLIAEELLACGTIPIVNDSPYPRADLDHPCVAWAEPTPAGIAAALRTAFADDGPTPTDIARGVRAGWGPAQQVLVDTVEREVRGT